MPRKRPNGRRASQNLGFNVSRRGDIGGPVPYTATIGYYRLRFIKEEICEIFLHSGKVGSDHQIATLELSVITSLAIQNGVPLDELRRSLPRDDEGNPEGPMGTLLDLIQETETADLTEELLE